MSVGWEIAQLEQAGQDVITVTVGEQFSKLDRAYAHQSPNRDDYNALMQAIGNWVRHQTRLLICGHHTITASIV